MGIAHLHRCQKNGEVVASAMEERFPGVKKDRSFPINAIKFCLEYENITIDDVDLVTFYMIPDLFYFFSIFSK